MKLNLGPEGPIFRTVLRDDRSTRFGAIRLIEIIDGMIPPAPPEGSDGGGGGSGPGPERTWIRRPSSVPDAGLFRDEAGRNADPSGADGGGSQRVHSGTGSG